MSKNTKDLFYMVGDVARMLNRSVQSIRIYEKRGYLRSLRTLSGVRIFRAEDIRKFAETSRTTSAAKKAKE
jgi:DNA-binding transcriptional MerR regulator